MQHFTILRYSVNNLLEEFGHDMIEFNVEIEKDGEERTIIIFFHAINKFCKVALPEVAAAFADAQKNLVGFGPKESQMWAVLQENNFDMLPVLNGFLKANPLYLQPPAYLTNPKQVEQAEVIADDLGASIGDMKADNIRYVAFMDEVQAELTNKVLSHYPEIFNSDPKHIIELKSIFTRSIMNLAEQVNNLAYKAENEI